MTPSQLTAFLERLISEELTISAMIWGPPGIGKSSIVSQAAKNKGYDFTFKKTGNSAGVGETLYFSPSVLTKARYKETNKIFNLLNNIWCKKYVR